MSLLNVERRSEVIDDRSDFRRWPRTCRENSINFGRISGVTNDDGISPADEEEVRFFRRWKESFHPDPGGVQAGA